MPSARQRLKRRSKVLFHLGTRQQEATCALLDKDELDPDIKQSTLYEDMETGDAIEVEPTYMARAYREKIRKHIRTIEEAANGIRADHVLLNTAEPLDRGLHNYLTFREKRG